MAFTFALSLTYLVVENLIVRAPLPMPIQRAFIGIGISGAISGFTLYFVGGG